MSQLVSVSSPASGREMLERYAAVRRKFRGPVRRPMPMARLRAVQEALAADYDVLLPPAPAPIAIPDPLVQEVAALQAALRVIRFADILKAVAKHFDVSRHALLQDSRLRHICRARQVAMYLGKEILDRSLPDLGHLLGGKDHTTILHGIRKIKELIAAGDPIASDVDAIRARLPA